MSLARSILRWRARQRREVWQSLWMHGPFTAVEARQLCRRINYSPLKAATLIRAHEKDQRAIELSYALELARKSSRGLYNTSADEVLCSLFGVTDPNALLNQPAHLTRARRMEIMRDRNQHAISDAGRLMREAHA